MASLGVTGSAGGPRRRRGKLWLGRLLVFLGLVLLTLGIVSAWQLLATPLEGQRPHVAPTVFPLVVGLWLLVSGIYTLKH